VTDNVANICNRNAVYILISPPSYCKKIPTGRSAGRRSVDFLTFDFFFLSNWNIGAASTLSAIVTSNFRHKYVTYINIFSFEIFIPQCFIVKTVSFLLDKFVELIIGNLRSEQSHQSHDDGCSRGCCDGVCYLGISVLLSDTLLQG
jgi:hypothetical protein